MDRRTQLNQNDVCLLWAKYKAVEFHRWNIHSSSSTDSNKCRRSIFKLFYDQQICSISVESCEQISHRICWMSKQYHEIQSNQHLKIINNRNEMIPDEKCHKHFIYFSNTNSIQRMTSTWIVFSFNFLWLVCGKIDFQYNLPKDNFNSITIYL